MVFLRTLFDFPQNIQLLAFILPDPPFENLMNRNGIQEVKLLPTTAGRDDQAGVLQSPQVLRHSLTCHCESGTQPAQRLPVKRAERVQQLSACRAGERLKDSVCIHGAIICKKMLACQEQQEAVSSKQSIGEQQEAISSKQNIGEQP